MSKQIYGNNMQKKGKGVKSGKKVEKQLRGYYAALFTQRGSPDEQLKESAMKKKCPIGNFDPKMIKEKRENNKTKIELLIEKEKNKIKLTSSDKIILTNYRAKEEKELKNDMKKLNEHGITAELSTNQGLLIQLLLIAKYQIDSNKPVEEKYKKLYRTYREVIKFDISDSIRKEYKDIFKEFDNISKKIDVIKLQFNEEHGYMPPCDDHGFTKLNDWQLQGLDYMDLNYSIIFKIPTSGGKTVLTCDHFKDSNAKIIVCVPSSALCFQVAAMIENITGKTIPIVTSTYQTLTDPKKMAEMIERVEIIVGTPFELNNFLVLENINKIKWTRIIIDEIHTIGSEDNKEMAFILQRFKNVPTTLLSATIGNVHDIYDWMKQIGHSVEIKIVESDKRFFNLQKIFFEKMDSLIRIHPLSAVTLADIENGNVLKMTLNETPPDVWLLAESLMKKWNTHTRLPTSGDSSTPLNIYKYFTNSQVITLAESTEYFNKLLTWMVENYKTHKSTIDNIINSYKHENLKSDSTNLYDVMMTLKNKEMTPALIFHSDSHQLLEYVKLVAIKTQDEENKKYPLLHKQRLKEQSLVKATRKKTDELKLGDMKEKQLNKELMKGTIDKMESSEPVSIYEPHSDFIFNKHQCFTQYNMDEINKELKRFFPQNGMELHWLLQMYRRGVGVYAKGLPDQYLQLIQIAACNGKLSIVYSDESLEAGVNMPFKTVVLTREKINPMSYHQRRGRAGRRGFDRVGYTVFFGWEWNEIQTISSTCIPDIVGADTMYYGSVFAKRVSGDIEWGNIEKNFLMKNITNEDANEFYGNIETNMMEEGGWNFAHNTNKDFQLMCWKLRQSEDCLRVPFLLDFLRKIFCNMNPNSNSVQIEFSKMILNFVDIIEATGDEHVLQPAMCYSIYPLKDYFEELGLPIPDKIDSQIFESIQLNKLIDTPNINEKSKLRNRLFKFGKKIETIQNYFFYSKEIVLARLIAKLLTRIYWIYHMSAPIMDSIVSYINMDKNSTEEVIIAIDTKYINTNISISESESDSSEEDSSDEDSSDEDSSDEDSSDEEPPIKEVSKSKFW